MLGGGSVKREDSGPSRTLASPNYQNLGNYYRANYFTPPARGR